MAVKKTKQISIISKSNIDATEQLRDIEEKQSYSSTSEGTMSVKHVSQTEIKTIGIFKIEWDFVSNSINDIYEKSSNWSLGNYLEGVLGTLFLPFFIELWKLISNPQAINIKEIQSDCKIYFCLIIFFTFIFILKKVVNPKCLRTYKDFDNDLKHINQRINEINNRIGVEKEKEE
ncbi:MAG: hypothetical protein PUF50_02850 [Erysipelotrichaceae bacterium]|nr:hypothetical protein [Erysipelotrichaceae bacterium]